jgi:hypothetical protein
MAQPIMLQAASLRKYQQAFSPVFTLPQWKYFVIVLLGLLLCDGAHTLSGLLRQLAVAATVSGLSRFMARSTWSVEALLSTCQVRFYAEVAPLVRQAHAQLRAQQPRRPGRRAETVVTGFLIIDDSTHVKRYAAKMEGLGRHYSTCERSVQPGHSLFQGLYLLLGRQLPLKPFLYRQKAVCDREQVPFVSKVELAQRLVETFEPAPGTHTHVLVDAWYTNKPLWRAARRRGWDITAGLRSNRRLRQISPNGQRVWVRLSEYTAQLSPQDFTAVVWPNQEGGKTVYAHLVRTKIKTLGACQVLIVKPAADAPADHAHYWATSRLHDTLEQVVQTAAQRWTVEVLFADFKELMGSDQYQLRSAQAIVAFWALGLCLYQYLDEQRVSLQAALRRHVTLGETRALLREQHQGLLLNWICDQSTAVVDPVQIRAALKPALAGLG